MKKNKFTQADETSCWEKKEKKRGGGNDERYGGVLVVKKKKNASSQKHSGGKQFERRWRNDSIDSFLFL